MSSFMISNQHYLPLKLEKEVPLSLIFMRSSVCHECSQQVAFTAEICLDAPQGGILFYEVDFEFSTQNSWQIPAHCCICSLMIFWNKSLFPIQEEMDFNLILCCLSVIS